MRKEETIRRTRRRRTQTRINLPHDAISQTPTATMVKSPIESEKQKLNLSASTRGLRTIADILAGFHRTLIRHQWRDFAPQETFVTAPRPDRRDDEQSFP